MRAFIIFTFAFCMGVMANVVLGNLSVCDMEFNHQKHCDTVALQTWSEPDTQLKAACEKGGKCKVALQWAYGETCYCDENLRTSTSSTDNQKWAYCMMQISLHHSITSRARCNGENWSWEDEEDKWVPRETGDLDMCQIGCSHNGATCRDCTCPKGSYPDGNGHCVCQVGELYGHWAIGSGCNCPEGTHIDRGTWAHCLNEDGSVATDHSKGAPIPSSDCGSGSGSSGSGSSGSGSGSSGGEFNEAKPEIALAKPSYKFNMDGTKNCPTLSDVCNWYAIVTWNIPSVQRSAICGECGYGTSECEKQIKGFHRETTDCDCGSNEACNQIQALADKYEDIKCGMSYYGQPVNKNDKLPEYTEPEDGPSCPAKETIMEACDMCYLQMEAFWDAKRWAGCQSECRKALDGYLTGCKCDSDNKDDYLFCRKARDDAKALEYNCGTGGEWKEPEVRNCPALDSTVCDWKALTNWTVISKQRAAMCNTCGYFPAGDEEKGATAECLAHLRGFADKACHCYSNNDCNQAKAVYEQIGKDLNCLQDYYGLPVNPEDKQEIREQPKGAPLCPQKEEIKKACNMCMIEQDAAWNVKVEGFCDSACTSLMVRVEEECSCKDYSDGSKQTEEDVLFCEKARSDYLGAKWNCDNKWKQGIGRPGETDDQDIGSNSRSAISADTKFCRAVHDPFPSCHINVEGLSEDVVKDKLCKVVVGKPCIEHISSIYGDCECHPDLNPGYAKKCRNYNTIASKYAAISCEA
eukprot:Nk52_evm35s2039 gene=Nk52_evmTU35s2039